MFTIESGLLLLRQMEFAILVWRVGLLSGPAEGGVCGLGVKGSTDEGCVGLGDMKVENVMGEWDSRKMCGVEGAGEAAVNGKCWVTLQPRAQKSEASRVMSAGSRSWLGEISAEAAAAASAVRTGDSELLATAISSAFQTPGLSPMHLWRSSDAAARV